MEENETESFTDLEDFLSVLIDAYVKFEYHFCDIEKDLKSSNFHELTLKIKFLKDPDRGKLLNAGKTNL